MSKIKFRVISCSGEDPQYPVTELLTQSPQSKGWQSPRFCDYPQEITLQFTGPVRLKQLQFLCHQSKIPSKLELFVYLPDMTSPIENNEFRYKKLGYIALDTNERSGYQARELKSVFLDNPCLYMKLVFHKCHVNKYNLFNQVSLIALSVFGDLLALNEEVQKNPKAPAGVFDRLEYETQFDPTTLDRLRVLEAAKDKAIRSEDYEDAKRIKEAIERLKQIGVQLQHMEERKVFAVTHDDFESAKIIKAEIDRLRSAIMPEALMGKYGTQSKGDLPPVQYNSHRPYSGAVQQNLPISPITQVLPKKEGAPPQRGEVIEENVEKKMDTTGYQKPTENPFNKKKKSEQEIENRSEILKEKEQNDHLKKAVRKDLMNNHDEMVIPAVSNKNKGDNMDMGMPEKEKDHPTDKLSPEQLKLVENIIDILTERCCEQLFSKNWTLREEGLKFLESELARPTTIRAEDAATLFQAIFSAVHFTIGDKIIQVSQRSISLLLNLLAKPTPKFQARNEMISYIDNVLGVLLEKIGDNNPRMKELAENAFLALANNPIVTCQNCVNALLRGLEKNKKSASFRHMAGRLTVLLEIVKNFGINNANVPFQSTVEFAIKNLDHQNPEVRNAAIALLVEIHKTVGEQKLMPLLENIRPAHMEILQAEFGVNGGGQKKKRDASKEKEKENVQVVTNIKPQSGKLQQKKDNQGNVRGDSSEKEETMGNKASKKGGGNNEGPKSALKTQQEQNKTCDFCGKIDKGFLERGKLDIHLWKDCPMLTLCTMCEQVVEIACLNSHLLEECDFKKSFRKCPRCKEAIHSNNYKQHTDEMACLPNKPTNVSNRCPLCHTDIMPGEIGWKNHLISEGCPNNERTGH